MARRETVIFSLAFLDVMCCGFGAIILVFLIINHAAEEEGKIFNQDILAEIRLLDYQVQDGERDLFELKERLEKMLQGISESTNKLISTRTDLDKSEEELAKLDADSLAQIKSLEELKSDVDTREEELVRLRALEAQNDGRRILSIEGEGDRQYLTGMKVGGKNVLIALDTSASMLDDKIVNVLRRRNMADERKRLAPKWQRAIRTVEWIAGQLPLDASFQIYGFNEKVESIIPESDGDWVQLDAGRELDAAIANLKTLIPDKGTSLELLIEELNRLVPLPDNVYLIIDSLPTMGTRPPRSATISGRARLDLFRDAVKRMPNQVPINVIMFPMEGDPMAAAAYWNLARTSGGSFLSPSRDWP